MFSFLKSVYNLLCLNMIDYIWNVIFNKGKGDVS